MEKINWNSTYEGNHKRRFIIPVGDIDEEHAKEILRKLRKSYSEEINLDNNDTSRIQNCKK